MTKKYELTDETIIVDGKILHRIKALADFGGVKKGDLGGFIEKEENLSQDGNCWIYNNAKVYGNAIIRDDAIVFDNAKVCDYAVICGYAIIRDDVKVSGEVVIKTNSSICGNAKVKNINDFIEFKNWWSSGRYFTWTKSNNMFKVGCFYGTGQELIKKAYKDSDISGREYERIVKYVEEIINNNCK